MSFPDETGVDSGNGKGFAGMVKKKDSLSV
jgi:hypothetical protein